LGLPTLFLFIRYCSAFLADAEITMHPSRL